MSTLCDTLPSGTAPLLSVAGLTVRYGREPSAAPALNELAFDLSAGEIVGILGESGSGKSTLALALLGLLPGTATVAGTILFQDHHLLRMNESSWRRIRGARISAISQEPGLALSPVMRVGDQVAEVIRAHGPSRGKTLRQKSLAMIREVCLADAERIYDAYPHQLSGGQLHRIAIAQALACRPDLVVADEPTRSLDVTVQTEIVDVLREVNRTFGSTLIFITHNPALLAGFADRVIVMYGGRIVEMGPVAKVFRQPWHPYTQALLRLMLTGPRGRDCLNGNRLPAIPGCLTDADRLSDGCVFEPRCSARTSVCQSESPIQIMPEQDRHVSCFNYGN